MTLQGRYTILGEIAAGGTATVFLAEDSVLRRKVALKKLHPHLLSHPEMVKRFEKEAVAVASLSHEHVIKIFDFGREDRSVFLAMEYVDGVSLEALVAPAKEGLPNLATLSLFRQLLDGLAAAHAAGLCHRDIKPSNVLIDRKGCVRIADFGIAYLSEDTAITRTGSYLGTPGYSSPEQAEGKAVTDKADIFAAGTVLYRCLTGRMPFAAESPHAVLKAIVEKQQPKANLVQPRTLPGLADLAQAMLSKAPGDRPAAEACVARLDSLAASLGIRIDARHLRQSLADPSAAAAEECRDLAARFAGQARELDKAGKTREAMKLYSLAEVFADKDSTVGMEAMRYVRKGILKVRGTAAAVAAAAVAVVALALWLGSGGNGSAPAVAAASPAIPEAPAPVSLPLPADIPEWPRMAAPTASPTASGMRPEGRPAAMPAATPTEAVAALAAVPAQSTAPDGWFWVKTNPPFARVILDGKDVASTPMASPIALPAGTHQVQVVREGCAPVTRTLQIQGGDTAFVRLTLERAGGDAAPALTERMEPAP